MKVFLLIFLFLNLNLSFYQQLYYFKLKNYFKLRYFYFIIKNKQFFINLIIVLSIFILYILKLTNFIYYLILIIFNFYYFLFNLCLILKKKKIKFKLTAKILRLVSYFDISIILSITIYFIIKKTITLNLLTFLVLIPSINFLSVILLATLDLYGYIESLIWKIKAIKKIKSNPKIIKIGITGSNGKTSVKNILHEFLSLKYNTVKTPKNFNTPKGIIYTINKLVTNETDCIIFEMGARKRKDIFQLCKISKPDIGIITNIAPQHMQTFKTIETVVSTKKELSDYLNNKLCIYNLNNSYCNTIFNSKKGEKISVKIFEYKALIKNKSLKSSYNSTKCRAVLSKEIFKINLPDLYAKNIHINNLKYRFELVYQFRRHLAETSLLGKHNITNILLATMLALKLNIEIDDIIKKISELQPTEHRLQLIKGRINILDDSYNCSIESAKCAIEVLSKFKGEKVVCTPGIIEGGKEQANLNIALAKMLKDANSINIIVGKTNKEYFKKVLSNDKTFYVDNLEQAKSHFNKLKSDSTLLLLNDLPDDYN